MDKFREIFWGDNNESKTDVTILPVVGNHEGHPLNYENYNDPQGFVHQRIFDAYVQFVGSERVADLIQTGFYSFVDTKRNLKFISLDSNLNSLFNTYEILDSTNPLNILINLSKSLYESENLGQKVVLLTHIPLADESSQTALIKYLKVVLERFSETIACSLSSHTHNDQIKFYKNKQNENMFAEFISPSLTTYTNMNPSYRMYKMAATGEVKDYSQYSLNIDVLNVYAEQNDFRFWFDLTYNLVEEYNIQTQDFWSNDNLLIYFIFISCS